MAPSTAVARWQPDTEQREALELLGINLDKVPATQVRLLFQLSEQFGFGTHGVIGKLISLIPGKGPFIGVWGRLDIAHRTGQFDGLEADDEWETETHYCVRAVVYRKDMSRPAAKVIGRVGRWEKKDWPHEIARARGVRAACGFAFNIRDAFDDQDEGWNPPPDERMAGDNIAPAPRPAATEPAVRRARTETPEAPGGDPEGPSGTGRNGDTEPTGFQRTRRRIQAAAPPPEPATVEHASAAVAHGLEHGRSAAPNEEVAEVVEDGLLSLAQQIAIAARKAGYEDEESRHDVVQAATDGRATRGKEVDPKDAERVLSAFKGLGDGTVELRYSESGEPELWRIRRP